MGRLQQRRLKYFAVAVVLTLVLSYTFLQDSVTWKLPPIHAPTQTTSGSSSGFILRLPLSPTLASLSLLPTGSPTPTKPDFPNSLGSDSPPTLPSAPKECIKYEQLQRLKQEPLSEGRRKFPYSRPSPECRTFNLPAMETLIEKMRGVIQDPDLFRLFENSYPNTLDTMIKWRGYAKELPEGTEAVTGNETTTSEELTYVITGDVRIFLPAPCHCQNNVLQSVLDHS